MAAKVFSKSDFSYSSAYVHTFCLWLLPIWSSTVQISCFLRQLLGLYCMRTLNLSHGVASSHRTDYATGRHIVTSRHVDGVSADNVRRSVCCLVLMGLRVKKLIDYGLHHVKCTAQHWNCRGSLLEMVGPKWTFQLRGSLDCFNSCP